MAGRFVYVSNHTCPTGNHARCAFETFNVYLNDRFRGEITHDRKRGIWTATNTQRVPVHGVFSVRTSASLRLIGAF